MDLHLEEDSSSSDEDEDRIENGFMDHEEDHDANDQSWLLSSSSSAASPAYVRTPSRESHGSGSHVPRVRQVSYDTTLPAQHSYLGSDLDVLPGRVIHEENSVITIPLLSIEGVILVPGQLLPMQLQHPSFVSMMSKIVGTDRTFGMTSNVSASGIGTTAEITSFSMENEEDGLPYVRIKAEGRQVFQIRETWRGADGILMGRVSILSECQVIHPFRSNILISTHNGCKHNQKLLPVSTPLPLFVYQQYDPELLMQQIMSHLESWATFDRKSRATSTRAAAAAAPTPGRTACDGPTDFSPAASPSPSSSTGTAPVRRVITKTVRMQDFHELHDLEEDSESDVEDDNVVHHEDDEDDDDLQFEQIPSPEELRHELMVDSKLDRNCSVAPENPVDFSYWVAANLPLEDGKRIELLSMRCAIQRLRWLLSVIQRYLYICCSKCESKICRKDDVFAMSIQGPQGTYVNPHGIVHETVTVYKADNLSLQGGPDTEFSWFPGYAWTICSCSRCGTHIGWKFTAVKDKSLKPEFFWGLSRNNISLGFKNDESERFTIVI